jgi:hypothetical protein
VLVRFFVAAINPGYHRLPLVTLARWRETCDQRMAVELGVAVLAAVTVNGRPMDVFPLAIFHAWAESATGCASNCR